MLLRNDRGEHILRKLEGSRYSIAGIPPGTWVVRGYAGGFVVSEEEVSFPPSGGLMRRDFRLEREEYLVIRCVDEHGTEFHEAMRERSENGLGSFRLWVIATEEHPGAALRPTDLDTYANYGVASFGSRDSSGSLRNEMPLDCLGRLQLQQPPPVFVSVLLRHVVLATQRVEVSHGEFTFRIPLADVLAVRGGFRARLVDAETGNPVGLARYSLDTNQHVGMENPVVEGETLSIEDLVPGI